MTTHTHRRRYTAAFFALTLPLAMAACGAEDETLSEPEMTSPPAASAAAEETAVATTEAAKEETSERPSTTVSTIYETEEKEAVAAEPDAGSEKGPCEWKPMEEGAPGEEVSVYCDGKFAEIGIYATDAVSYVMWDGNEWVHIEEAGLTQTGFKCYDKATIEKLGAPEEIKENMIYCE